MVDVADEAAPHWVPGESKTSDGNSTVRAEAILTFNAGTFGRMERTGEVDIISDTAAIAHVFVAREPAGDFTRVKLTSSPVSEQMVNSGRGAFALERISIVKSQLLGLQHRLQETTKTDLPPLRPLAGSVAKPAVGSPVRR